MTGTVKSEPGLGHEVVGREAELAQLHAFLYADPGGAAFVLVGGPGIGKTTLWENGVEAARQRGMRVLVARLSDAEARLAFSALIDLFDGVASEELAGLPPPQLHALDVALLRAVSAVEVTERDFTFRFRSAEEFVEFFRTWYGPTLKAFAALDTDARRQALEHDLVELARKHDRLGTGDAIAIPSAYTEAVAITW